MKKRGYLLGILVALIAFGSLGGIALASGWVGPYDDYDWDSFEHGWGGECEIDHYTYWYEYWDDSEQRTTYYNIKGGSDIYGCSWIQVDPDSDYDIIKENPTLYDYTTYNVVCTYKWYVVIEPGEDWDHYYPESDEILTKPESNDATRLDWWYVWDYVFWAPSDGWARKGDGINYFYSIRDFQSHSGYEVIADF